MQDKISYCPAPLGRGATPYTVQYSGVPVLLNSVTDKMAGNDYVRVFALDFTKAFDTVRHSRLMHKFAKINLPDAAYNWIKDFLTVEPTARNFREKSRNLPTDSPASSSVLV